VKALCWEGLTRVGINRNEDGAIFLGGVDVEVEEVLLLSVVLHIIPLALVAVLIEIVADLKSNEGVEEVACLNEEDAVLVGGSGVHAEGNLLNELLAPVGVVLTPGVVILCPAPRVSHHVETVEHGVRISVVEREDREDGKGMVSHDAELVDIGVGVATRLHRQKVASNLRVT